MTTSENITNNHLDLTDSAIGHFSSLLKNKDNQLPLKPSSKIAVIGAFAKNAGYQSKGGSQLVATTLDNAFDCISLELLGFACICMYVVVFGWI